MPYNKFDLQTLVTEFDLEILEDTRLFPNVQPVEPSDLLKTILEENVSLATAINTEKARGELIIFPILLEVKRRINVQISVFSGKEFNVDFERGLNGNPDFMISRNRKKFFITDSIITLLEAKKPGY